ncbi:hypothetical protein CJU89_4076 [Yarrowia sp. B02]|nr:hypothetical protein CJU89_4076 [Yarrowia sp. B02]
MSEKLSTNDGKLPTESTGKPRNVWRRLSYVINAILVVVLALKYYPALNPWYKAPHVRLVVPRPVVYTGPETITATACVDGLPLAGELSEHDKNELAETVVSGVWEKWKKGIYYATVHVFGDAEEFRSTDKVTYTVRYTPQSLEMDPSGTYPHLTAAMYHALDLTDGKIPQNQNVYVEDSDGNALAFSWGSQISPEDHVKKLRNEGDTCVSVSSDLAHLKVEKS